MQFLEPEQGVPRYITSKYQQHSDSLVRRGQAFIVEHGFWQTELGIELNLVIIDLVSLNFILNSLGRKHYQMNLLSIRNNVHETCVRPVLRPYLFGVLLTPQFFDF